MVDEPALAILKRQGSWGITIVSLQRKIIFDIQFNPYWPKWQTRRSKLLAKDFETSRISPRHMKSLPHVRVCFGTCSMEHNIKSRATTVI
jgi:hypothetical protein